jgi:hypothetical protein
MAKDLTSVELGELPNPVRTYRKRTLLRAVQVDEPFSVDTLEGRMEGQAGDFLGIGVHEERYPIAASVMADSYEET